MLTNLNNYEQLLQQAYNDGVMVHVVPMTGHKGLYFNNCILLNTSLQSNAEKVCILAEELAHHYSAVGDITKSSVASRKQEMQGRRIAIESLIPPDVIAEAIDKQRCHSIFEIAEYLQITEEFLHESIEHYRRKYGICVQTQYGALYLNPLGLLVNID